MDLDLMTTIYKIITISSCQTNYNLMPNNEEIIHLQISVFHENTAKNLPRQSTPPYCYKAIIV